MHIGFYSPGLPSSGRASGILTYVGVMRAALLALGHEVTVVAENMIERADGEVIAIPPEPVLSKALRHGAARLGHGGHGPLDHGAVLAGRLARARRLAPFDLFEIEESFGWTAQIVRRAAIPVVTRLHGPHVYGRNDVETDAERAESARRIVAEGKAIDASTAISCPSARLMAATLDHYRLRPALAEVIPNPIAPASERERWSAGACDAHQVLHVGRFDLRKGADVAIQAFLIAGAADPALTLVIAGPDTGIEQPDGRRIHFAEYLATAVPPAMRARIRFTGPIGRDALAALRRGSGICLVPSRFENFAYSVAEAMAAGTPLIVSDSFGNAEMVEDGVSGVVVPVGDVAATARAITRMTADPEAAAEMGARARARCEHWLSPARIAERTVELYERTLAARSGER